MAIVNDVCSLAAILSGICDDTDTNLLYMISVPKIYCKCVANNMNFNSMLTTWMPPSYKQTRYHVTETAGIKVFSTQKNESALTEINRSVKDRSRKSGSIQERSKTKLTPDYTE